MRSRFLEAVLMPQVIMTWRWGSELVSDLEEVLTPGAASQRDVLLS